MWGIFEAIANFVRGGGSDDPAPQKRRTVADMVKGKSIGFPPLNNPYVPNNPPCPLCGQQYDQYGYCRCDPIALAPDFTKGVIPSAVVDPQLLYGGDARSKKKKGITEKKPKPAKRSIYDDWQVTQDTPPEKSP